MRKINDVKNVGEFNKTLSALLLENNISIDSEASFAKMFPDKVSNLTYLEMMEKLTGTDEFVEKIISIMNEKSHPSAVILGDYDCDGVLGTVILMEALSALGFNTTYHIPNRLTDGYGMKKNIAESPRALSADIIITVDNGIAAKETISLLQKMGQNNIIVTDHHLPEEENVPENVLIIDPKYNNDKESDICGACVAMKLVVALYCKLGYRIPPSFVAFAGIATIADMMPMLGENRVLVKDTMNIINAAKFNYTADLFGVYELVKNLGGNLFLNNTEVATPDLISFFIAPNINAVSRVHGNVNFLVRDIFNSLAYGQSYKSYVSTNLKRRGQTAKLTADCIIDEDSESQVILFNKDQYDFPIQGLIGLVANKISSTKSKVTLVGYQEGNKYDFSGRGVPGYNLYDAIMRIANNHPELGITGGGHASAMGIHMKTDIENASEKLKNLLNEDIILNKQPVENNNYEFNDEIEEEVISTLKEFYPYGQGFKSLTFTYTGEFKSFDNSTKMAEIGDFLFRYFASKEEQQDLGRTITVNFNITFEDPSTVTFKCLGKGA